MKIRYFILFGLLVASNAFSATRYEAESAVGQNVVVNGTIVQMQEGNLTFTVSVDAKGMYDLLVRYSQSYGDSKVQNLVVNGVNVGGITFPKTANASTWSNVSSVVSLNKGTNTIALTKSWGWVDIDYIEIASHERTMFNVTPNLINKNANEPAKKVYSFMREKFQKKIISGVMTLNVLDGNAPLTVFQQEDVAHVRAASQKTPAILGLDFMHATGKSTTESWYVSYTASTLAMAKEIYDLGGIPTYSWHWRDPSQKTTSFYSGGDAPTDFDFTAACVDALCASWNTSSTTYKEMIRDIDIIAGYLKTLQTEGVAVLWRPLHEASGGWFWWGAKGAVPFKALYKLVFDRLTTHHGLNNLIWVWNSDGSDASWYPGSEYVDIIGRDFYYYPREVNHASLIGEFETIKNVFGTSKMISLSEHGSVPYPENLIADGADWSYFMPWYGDYVTQDNSVSDWNKIMNHEYVITLEDMPGWANYTVGLETPLKNTFNAVRYENGSLRFSQSIAAETSIEVFDLKGASVGVLHRGALTAGEHVFSLKNYSKGVYFVRVKSAMQNKTVRVSVP